MLQEPEIEALPWAQQQSHDEPLYREQIRYLFDRSRFFRDKLEPSVKAGKLDRATAEILPDVLSAFLDGICVRLVLDDEDSVSRLSKNIETFLCKIVG